MASEMTERIVGAIRAVPPGAVASYGQIAIIAGHPRGSGAAREVVRVLSSMSRKENLPWWRIVRRDGGIALPEGEGAELQKELLRQEGVAFDKAGKIAARYFWDGGDDQFSRLSASISLK